MTTIVPTGEMVIGRHGLLKTFLSSCLGLAIHDRGNGLGGVLHILLPEPLGSVPDYHRSYYASTGIPAFIDALIEQGAQVEGMEAFIAGGALIDPFSSRDPSINFAHRTLDITFSLMKRYGVSVRTVEASGLNPFCLTLDLDTGTCRIEPILLAHHEAETPGKPVGTAGIRQTIDRLLPVPQMAFTISQMLSDEDTDVTTVAEEIKKDQVLSAKVLRICNSSYMGLSRKVASVDQSVVLLGSKLLLQIVITAQIENIFHATEGGYSLCRGGIFHHALATARLCKALAKAQGRIDPDVAYTAGLLHDIGKVVLDQYIAGVRPFFYRMVIEQKKDSSRAEKEIMGIDHCRAGLMLAESWNLPEVLMDAICFHHTPHLYAGDSQEVVNLTYVADVLTNRLLPGLELDRVDTSNLRSSLEMLHIPPRSIYEHLSVLANLY